MGDTVLWRAAVFLMALLLSPSLQGCWPFVGDVTSRTWIMEVYASSETMEGAVAELERLAEQAGIVDLKEDYWEEWYWGKKDLPSEQRQIQYTGRTILDRVHTGVVVIDLRNSAGIRFVFSGDADDDDSMKVIIADLIRVMADRFGPTNVAVKFEPGAESPGLILSRWEAGANT